MIATFKRKTWMDRPISRLDPPLIPIWVDAVMYYVTNRVIPNFFKKLSYDEVYIIFGNFIN